MAIFGSKKEKEEKGEDGNAKQSKTEVLHSPLNLSRVLIKPRITEKASYKTEKDNAYVFEVAKDAGKAQVSKAVSEIYKVEPVKVNIVKNPSKRVFVRGKKGVKSGVKKAYVYLKKGDKIEVI